VKRPWTDEARVYSSDDSATPDPLDHPLGMTLLVLGAFIGVGVPVQLLNVAFGAWFSELMIFLAIPYLAMRMRGLAPLHSAGAWPVSWVDAAWGFAMGAANFFGVVAPTQYVMQKVLPASWLQEYDATQIFRNQTPFELVLIVLAVGVAAPVCEELFFRGCLQRTLIQRRGLRSGIVLSALLFSAFHLERVGFLARFELGLLFGLLAYRSGNLWAGIGAHAGNNLVSTGLFFFFKDQEHQLQDPPLQSILGMGAMGTATLFLLFTAWARWKEKRPPVPLEVRRLTPWTAAAAARVWFVAAGMALALLLAVDARGVRVNWVDTKHRIPPESPSASPEERSGREALRNVRKRARRGEVSIQEYAALRQRMAEQLKAGSRPTAK